MNRKVGSPDVAKSPMRRAREFGSAFSSARRTCCASMLLIGFAASACAEPLVPSQVLYDLDGTPIVLLYSDIVDDSLRNARTGHSIDSSLIRFWPSTHPTALRPDGTFEVISLSSGVAVLQVIEAASLKIRNHIEIDPRLAPRIAPGSSYRPSLQYSASFTHSNCAALSGESLDWAVDVARDRVLMVRKVDPRRVDMEVRLPYTTACFVTDSGELRYVRALDGERDPELALCTFDHSRSWAADRRVCEVPSGRLSVKSDRPLPGQFSFLTADGDFVLAGVQGVAAIRIPQNCWSEVGACKEGETLATAEWITALPPDANIVQISISPDAREFLLFEYDGCDGRSAVHLFVAHPWTHRLICAPWEAFAAGALGSGQVAFFSGDNRISAEVLSY